MKKLYDTPLAETVTTVSEDVIRTSGLSAMDEQGKDIVLDWGQL